eukprot:398340-Hanusia_phi.AAC.1
MELAGALRREGNAPHAGSACRRLSSLKLRSAICCMSAAHCQRALESPLKAANFEVQAGEVRSEDVVRRLPSWQLTWHEAAVEGGSEEDPIGG